MKLNELTMNQIVDAAMLSDKTVYCVLNDIFGGEDYSKRDEATMEGFDSRFQGYLEDFEGNAVEALSWLIDRRAEEIPEYYKA